MTAGHAGPPDGGEGRPPGPWREHLAAVTAPGGRLHRCLYADLRQHPSAARATAPPATPDRPDRR
ncbi:hypothetical protein B0I33_101443 [Prauserella shujinwangii]|uniref:Uncharacterized protein n=1 Tax=Prauserella shujinwangii TaxID=1453103 RepID=A0A2T0M3I6_9PSEU|nr:hypothetical protein [Prauserella shujinwangii]PRX51290.1 hypothetical protein B0I33_101443 [Prauserella shujinwangii]